MYTYFLSQYIPVRVCMSLDYPAGVLSLAHARSRLAGRWGVLVHSVAAVWLSWPIRERVDLLTLHTASEHCRPPASGCPAQKNESGIFEQYHLPHQLLPEGHYHTHLSRISNTITVSLTLRPSLPALAKPWKAVREGLGMRLTIIVKRLNVVRTRVLFTLYIVPEGHCSSSLVVVLPLVLWSRRPWPKNKCRSSM